MKKMFLTFAIVTLSTFIVKAQTLDLKKAQLNGITLSGDNTLSTDDKTGTLVLPVENYKDCKGLQLSMQNFSKLSENASNIICSIVIEYKNADGAIVKAPAGFWVTGKKDLKFDTWKVGSSTIVNIDPSTISKIYIEIEKNKKLDVAVNAGCGIK
jgi:hypothetical protein